MLQRIVYKNPFGDLVDIVCDITKTDTGITFMNDLNKDKKITVKHEDIRLIEEPDKINITKT